MPNATVPADREAMSAAPIFTREEIATAFAKGCSKPMWLRDVLKMKRERGDTDIDGFKDICRFYAHGFNASIQGAAYSMRQWVRKPHASAVIQARREAFLADLEAVMAGTFFNDSQKLAA